MADLPFFGNSSFGGGGGIISGNPVVDAELAENGDMILKMSLVMCQTQLILTRMMSGLILMTVRLFLTMCGRKCNAI